MKLAEDDLASQAWNLNKVHVETTLDDEPSMMQAEHINEVEALKRVFYQFFFSEKRSQQEDDRVLVHVETSETYYNPFTFPDFDHSRQHLEESQADLQLDSIRETEESGSAINESSSFINKVATTPGELKFMPYAIKTREKAGVTFNINK